VRVWGEKLNGNANPYRSGSGVFPRVKSEGGRGKWGKLGKDIGSVGGAHRVTIRERRSRLREVSRKLFVDDQSR